MDEIYRMLGREREADFEREARTRRLAAVARTSWSAGPKVSEKRPRKRGVLTLARLAALLH